MNRKQFLKKIGLGALAVTVAPKIIGDIKEAPLKAKPIEPVLEETDTYYEATTLFPEWDGAEVPERNYIAGIDPFVNDQVFYKKTNKLYLVVYSLNGEAILRPFEIGDDMQISRDEYKKECLVLCNFYKELRPLK